MDKLPKPKQVESIEAPSRKLLSPAEGDRQLRYINSTARQAYKAEGPGIGGSADAVHWAKELCGVNIDSSHRVLDVGFGNGASLRECVGIGCQKVCGVDLTPESIDEAAKGAEVHLLDVSHEPLPWEDDTFNVVFCTETIEHLSNPFFMVSEVKRVLEHDGLFVLAFPRPEDNLGYGGGQHAHVYPGFLRSNSFKRFMMQMYFRAGTFRVNGSSLWSAWRNYKGEGMVDTFKMIAGNFTEKELYGVMYE